MPRRRPKHLRLRIALLGVLAGAIGGWSIYSRRQPGSWQHVFATREGMIGSMTSSRMIIRPGDRFVALPDRRALGRDVEIRYRDRVVVVPVRDVGPWNIDDPYWVHDARPASERGRGAYRTPVNRAGIDLSDAVFAELGLSDNDYVDWRFVHRDYVAWPVL
jgi:hypothetical protein